MLLFLFQLLRLVNVSAFMLSFEMLGMEWVQQKMVDFLIGT